jgi:hypothetical protein
MARTRHAPTPRNPSLPPTASVTARLVFVQSCPDCREIASGFAAGCIADGSVSSLSLVVGRTHCHEVTAGSQALPGLAKPADEEEGTDDPDSDLANHCRHGLTEGCCAVCDLPVSDTNGNLQPHQLPNGFD